MAGRAIPLVGELIIQARERVGRIRGVVDPAGKPMGIENDGALAVTVHYPIPIHLQGAFKHLGQGPGAFPVTEKAAGEILTLPLYPQITPQQQERVVDELRKAIG